MPDPKKFKSHSKFMEQCMHTQKQEKGSLKGDKLAPAVGKCMGMWRGKKKKKKCASDILREVAAKLASVKG